MAKKEKVPSSPIPGAVLFYLILFPFSIVFCSVFSYYEVVLSLGIDLYALLSAAVLISFLLYLVLMRPRRFAKPAHALINAGIGYFVFFYLKWVAYCTMLVCSVSYTGSTIVLSTYIEIFFEWLVRPGKVFYQIFIFITQGLYTADPTPLQAFMFISEFAVGFLSSLLIAFFFESRKTAKAAENNIPKAL